MIIARVQVSRAVFPILMVHHFLRTMSIFERSVTCRLFQELYAHIDKNSGETFEDIFLVKIANKGTYSSCLKSCVDYS